ncbi:hypothetical protein NN561_017222 [Cricetulus griseus]
MRMAFHRPATEPSLFSSLSPPPLPGRPSQEPLQRGPALSPGQPLGRANRKRKLSSQARAGEVGARLSLHGPGEGPSPSFHLEARRLRSVAFRYPGEPALSLPPPCICGSESLAPLRSDFRPLLWRSASLSGPADPVGWPRRVGGLGERAASAGSAVPNTGVTLCSSRHTVRSVSGPLSDTGPWASRPFSPRCGKSLVGSGGSRATAGAARQEGPRVPRRRRSPRARVKPARPTLSPVDVSGRLELSAATGLRNSAPDLFPFGV